MCVHVCVIKCVFPSTWKLTRTKHEVADRRKAGSVFRALSQAG